MFIGETLCFIAFEILYFFNKHKLELQQTSGDVNVVALISGNRNFNPFIFLPASLCDMIASSLAFIGLNLTYASSYQMLNGIIYALTSYFLI